MKKVGLIIGAMMIMAGTSLAHDGKKECSKKEACCKKDDKTAKAESKPACCKKDGKTAEKDCHEKEAKAKKSKKDKKKNV
jgi:hypothetical protein